MAARFRSNRIRHANESKPIFEEPAFIFEDRGPAENYRSAFLDIINLKHSPARRLSQLNALVRYCKRLGSAEEHGISLQSCVRYLAIPLCDACKEIRAACFRVLRHSTTSTAHCEVLRKGNVGFYIARALDVSLDNELERVQAMLLARKMVQLGDVPDAVVGAMIALASETGEDRERMTRVCLETLCEMLLMCPGHAGVATIIRTLMQAILASTSVQLTTAVIASIAHFASRIQPTGASNFCDLTHILSPVTAIEGRYDDARKRAIEASKSAIVAAVRSWEGLYLLTKSNLTGIQSLVGVLFLNDPPAHEAVLDIVTQLLFISKDYDSSLLPCDSWNMQEDFVAAEAHALLPHVGRTRMNLCANFLALLLFVFQECGLIDGLVCLITSQPNLHRRGLYLLNSFLSLASVYLPAEFTAQMQSLPVLVSLATTISRFNTSAQGSEAVEDLFRCSSERANQNVVPKNTSLYLEHVLDMMGKDGEWLPVDGFMKESDVALVKESHVLLSNEYVAWNWTLIMSLLRAHALHTSDSNGYKFLHRLSVFYKPSNKLFSVVPKKHDLARCYSRCGSYFMEVLLRQDHEMLGEFLTDFTQCLSLVLDDPSANAIFNPLKLFSSCSSDYFIFVGKVSGTAEGDALLEKTHVYQLFSKLAEVPDIHEAYIKLIVTTLDYRRHGLARVLLGQILTSCSLSLKRYATLHLRTLMRARMPGFSGWAIGLLVAQLKDPNIIVAQTAARILDEACDEKNNVDMFIHAKPSLEHLSPLTESLTARILGSSCEFDTLGIEVAKVEMEKWMKDFNKKYVGVVEQLLNTELLTAESSERTAYQYGMHLPEIFLPEHLFGQLVQHVDGCDLVREEMEALAKVVKPASSTNPSSSLDLKAALWALGHVGRTVDGMAMLSEFQMLDAVVALAASHDNVSIKGTAYFVLGLWSTTERGADLMKSRDWLAVRHHRHERWPLVDQRVHYTWESTTARPTFPLAAKSSRLISFTDAPFSDFRASSPIPILNDGFSSDGPMPHKTSRGESGFESSDGGLTDYGAGFGRKDEKVTRSASEKNSEISIGSYGSVENCYDNSMTLPVMTAPSPDGGRGSHSMPRSRTSMIRMTSYRETRGLSEDNRTRRSETRHSFRSLVHSVKHASGFLRKISAPSAPLHFSPSISPLQTAVSVRQPAEPSAREERFVGISVPLKRSVWQRRAVYVPEKEVGKNYIALGANLRQISQQMEWRSGLQIHTMDNCMACSIVGRDLSKAESDTSRIVLRRKEVLRFLGILATPIGHKAAEQGLLQLKNQLPNSFLDPCLYSEVCHLLATFSFKLSIRRLIQELFLDVQVPLQKALLEAFEADLSSVAQLAEESGPGDETAIPSSRL